MFPNSYNVFLIYNSNFLTNYSYQCLVARQVLGVQVPLVPGLSCPISANIVALILFWGLSSFLTLNLWICPNTHHV